MKDQFLHKKFVFNEKIDENFVFSLYEDDFVYIEEIFKTTIDQLITEIPAIPVAFLDGDITTVKRIIHKVKPAFGFTGFVETEKACKKFEDAFDGKVITKELQGAYNSLWPLIEESMNIMQSEYHQLKEFNSK